MSLRLITPRRTAGSIAAACLALALLFPSSALAAVDPDNSDVSGTVTDSATGQALQGAQVSVLTGQQQLVSRVLADAFGRFVIHNVKPGQYSVLVRLIGFRPEDRAVTLKDGKNVSLTFKMAAVAVTLQQISVNTAAPIAIDTRSGVQV